MAEKKASVKKTIEKELSKQDKEDLKKLKCTIKEGVKCNGTGGCAYFLGFIGALVYYVTTAPSLWDAVLGFFKALVWPAFLVYGLLLFIGA